VCGRKGGKLSGESPSIVGSTYALGQRIEHLFHALAIFLFTSKAKEILGFDPKIGIREGLRLFIEELIYSLQENQVIEKKNGRFVIISRFDSIHIPDTIHGIVFSAHKKSPASAVIPCVAQSSTERISRDREKFDA
jgi:hypothetical protein